MDKPTGLKKYVWRTDLLKTMPFWEGWFKGLTETFLNVKVKKQLLLAELTAWTRSLLWRT